MAVDTLVYFMYPDSIRNDLLRTDIWYSLNLQDGILVSPSGMVETPRL